MKAYYHTQNRSLRVIQRGRRYYVQSHSEVAGTRTLDPWCDIGKGRDTFAEAKGAMYSREPIKERPNASA